MTEDKQALSYTMDSDNNNLSFQWGSKRGIGGIRRNVQFYESFTFDNTEYSLYDYVYVFKDGETEPFIGKILKIWEQANCKKVKILWFFRPSEVQNFLGDYSLLKKEIFLASDEGVGLSNINPLEAIVGKCHVICTSKDKRNPQPSIRELEMADHIFYCTFNVGTCTISDLLPDTIAGIGVRLLLNPNKDQKSANGTGEPVKQDVQVMSSLATGDVNEGNLPSEVTSLLGEKLAAKSITSSTKDGSSVKAVVNQDEEKPNYFKDLPHSNLSNERPNKEMKQMDGKVESSNNLQKKTKLESETTRIAIKTNDDSSFPLQMKSTGKCSEKHSADETPKKASNASSVEDVRKVDADIVCQRQNADRSTWFKGVSWKSKLQSANKRGTLLFLDNVDLSLTSTDIEDFFYRAFKESCTAKVIPRGTFHNPNYGRVMKQI